MQRPSPAPRPASFPTAALAVALLLGGLPMGAPGTLQAQDARLPVDTAITSTHEVTIGGERVPYRATVGTLPVFDGDGEPVASLLYTFYERTDTQDDPPTNTPTFGACAPDGQSGGGENQALNPPSFARQVPLLGGAQEAHSTPGPPPYPPTRG